MLTRSTAARVAAALAVAIWMAAAYTAARRFLPPPRAAAPALTAADVEAVIANIQIIRQLKFKRAVPYRFLTTDQALAILLADARREGDEAKDRLAAKVGAMIGLLPPGTDLDAASMKVLRRQLGGFYDFRSKQLVVIKDGFAHSALAGAMGARELRMEALMVLAHELTRALQDQNFGLGAALDRTEDEDDPALALRAVAEGDATLAGIAYLVGRMDDRVADVVVAHIPDMYNSFAADTRDVPRAVAETFLFQYTDGTRFVARAYHGGGWAGVDNLYRRLPSSTQEVLHPGLYFDSPAPVPVVRIAGYAQALPRWKKQDEGTYGELGLREVIEYAIGADPAAVALARGWAGDRAVALARGDSLAVIWMIAFRDVAAAKAFAAKYAAALDRIHASRVAHRVARRDHAVLAIIGVDPAQMPILAASIWKNSPASAAPGVIRPPLRTRGTVRGAPLAARRAGGQGRSAGCAPLRAAHARCRRLRGRAPA